MSLASSDFSSCSSNDKTKFSAEDFAPFFGASSKPEDLSATLRKMKMNKSSLC